MSKQVQGKTISNSYNYIHTHTHTLHQNIQVCSEKEEKRKKQKKNQPPVCVTVVATLSFLSLSLLPSSLLLPFTKGTISCQTLDLFNCDYCLFFLFFYSSLNSPSVLHNFSTWVVCRERKNIKKKKEIQVRGNKINFKATQVTITITISTVKYPSGPSGTIAFTSCFFHLVLLFLSVSLFPSPFTTFAFNHNCI